MAAKATKGCLMKLAASSRRNIGSRHTTLRGNHCDERSTSKSMLKTLGHLLLSGIFITGGADAFLKPGGRATKVSNAGIPEPEQAVVLNGAVMVAGGTALALGFFPKLAALLLIGSLVPTTLVGHAFWKEKDATSIKNQQTQFMKNLGLIGALLLVLREK